MKKENAKNEHFNQKAISLSYQQLPFVGREEEKALDYDEQFFPFFNSILLIESREIIINSSLSYVCVSIALAIRKNVSVKWRRVEWLLNTLNR